MDIFNKAYEPPHGLDHETFVLFPTDASFYESDYATVMKCRQSLRLWSQSTWPEDTFTADDNKHDLELHVEDNKAHSAYGFMIYTPDRSTCLGSVYVNPIAQVLENYRLTESERRAISRFDARIDFWTNSECADTPRTEEFDSIFTKALAKWFAQSWKIKPAFSARRGMAVREQVYKSLGFEKRADITKIEADGSSVSLLLFN